MFPNLKQIFVTLLNATPIGKIDMYAGLIDTNHSAPEGWLLCDGNEVSKTTYAGLYAVIGDFYGTPQNSNNFVLPNMQGRFPVGTGTLDGVTYSRNTKGGNSTTTLSTANLPAHTHGSKTITGSFESRKWGTGSLFVNPDGTVVTITDSTNTGNVANTTSTSKAYHHVTINATHEHDSVGLGTAFDNKPPYIGVNFIIYAGV